jgi:site-specific DNA-methyltransferase (adenine-specific)
VRPYYDHGGITIYNGDCRSVLGSVNGDVCITDPPYAEQTHEGALTGSSSLPRTLIDFASVNADELRDALSLVDVRRWLVVTMDWHHVAPLEERPPVGFHFIRFGVWVKPNPTPQFSGDRPAHGWEAVALFHRPGRKRWNGGGRPATWNVPKVTSDHPTGKPMSLVRQFVQLFSDAGETILDPFMGSGTTLRAAKDLGRKAIGIEIEERYCEIAAKRLSQEVLTFAAPPEPHNAGRSKTCCTWDTCGCTAYVGGER